MFLKLFILKLFGKTPNIFKTKFSKNLCAFIILSISVMTQSLCFTSDVCNTNIFMTDLLSNNDGIRTFLMKYETNYHIRLLLRNATF